MEIGEFLRIARRERNFSLKELGEKTTISFSHLGKIERGEKKPNIKNLEVLAEALNIDKTTLLRMGGFKIKQTNVNAETRYKVIMRDKAICQICGVSPIENSIDVMMINPNKLPAENNLLCLCTQCLKGREEFILSNGLENDPIYLRYRVQSIL